MNFILRLKRGQIFPVLIAGLFLSNTTIEGDQTLTTILSIAGVIIYFSWVLLTGHALYQITPDRIDLNYNLFLINSFIWLASYTGSIAISDRQGVTFTGVAAFFGFYLFYAFLHFLMFPARTLRSIENNRKAEIGECIGDFFLIVFLPIGIWFLQPRMNKVAKGRGTNLETEV
jgi:hypothetical protein